MPRICLKDTSHFSNHERKNWHFTSSNWNQGWVYPTNHKYTYRIIFQHIQDLCIYTNSFFFSFCFLGPHQQHMEVLRLGVESELQLPAYATVIATQDPSHICDLHHSSRQHQIPDSLSKARDWTCILMDSFPLHHNGNSPLFFFKWLHPWHMEVPGPGSESELQLRPTLQL